MQPWIVDDDVWALIQPLLPPWPERSPGPRPVPDRLCLQGILYVLHHDIPWQLLPSELGFGSGQTCWRRLKRWQEAGVFDELQRILLVHHGHALGGLAWSRVSGERPHARDRLAGAGVGAGVEMGVEMGVGGGLGGGAVPTMPAWSVPDGAAAGSVGPAGLAGPAACAAPGDAPGVTAEGRPDLPGRISPTGG